MNFSMTLQSCTYVVVVIVFYGLLSRNFHPQHMLNSSVIPVTVVSVTSCLEPKPICSTLSGQCLHLSLDFCDSLDFVMFHMNKETALSAKKNRRTGVPSGFVRFFSHWPRRTSIRPSHYSVKLMYCG